MKKVLALVLAVIMVCTMAMAVTVITPADVTVVASELPQVVESDADATYGIDIPSDYYNADLANKVVEASNVTLAKKEGKLYVVVPTLDKALDGVADFTFTGTLKVTDKNDSTTFYVYSIKDGKLQQTSGQVKGIPVSATALKTWNDAVPLGWSLRNMTLVLPPKWLIPMPNLRLLSMRCLKLTIMLLSGM